MLEHITDSNVRRMVLTVVDTEVDRLEYFLDVKSHSEATTPASAFKRDHRVARRAWVRRLRREGLTRSEIADFLDVPITTIDSDIRSLRGYSH